MTTLCQTSFLQTSANKASEWFFVDLILSCKKTNEIWWNIMATVTVTQLKDLIHQHINVCITYVCKTRVTKYVDGMPMSLSSTSAHPIMVTLVNIMVMNRWLTSFSFYINQPSHSWDTAISNSDIKTPRSRSLVWSKWPSILFIHFLSISHQSDQQFLRYSYLDIWPWNIQSQGHEWRHMSMTHIIPSIQLMLFIFVPHQSDQPFLRYG